jgi:anaerobic selenocysteine-containing dehydrogenase
MSGNKLAMLGNAGSWYDAFPEIDFCICQYPMLTSFQMERADVVFPLEEWLEFSDSGGFGQLNYVFGQFPSIHLGETVPNGVPPQKIVKKASEILNAAIDSGEDIVFGAVGAATGAGPAQPSLSSTAKDEELQTSINASYLHECDTSRFNLRFPLGIGVMGGTEEETITLQTLAEMFGASDFADLKANAERYQKPIVTPPEAYWLYDQHLRTAADGLPVGFGTESRKCEVYCTLLIRCAATGYPFTYPRLQEAVDPTIGEEIRAVNPSYEFAGSYSPICQHVEPAESPIEGDPGYDAEYPLTITSGRVYYFHHGTMRHAAFARELYPVPDVRMHPDTAKKYGLKHMDWVKVTSHRGEITGRVYETAGMHPSVLWMERFWNPESFDSTQKSKSGGWRQMNVNVITKNTAPYNEVYGSYTNRGFSVKIEKGSRPEGVWVDPKEFTPFLPTAQSELYPDIGTVISQPQTDVVAFDDWSPLPPMMGGAAGADGAAGGASEGVAAGDAAAGPEGGA